MIIILHNKTKPVAACGLPVGTAGPVGRAGTADYNTGPVQQTGQVDTPRTKTDRRRPTTKNATPHHQATDQRPTGHRPQVNRAPTPPPKQTRPTIADTTPWQMVAYRQAAHVFKTTGPRQLTYFF